MSILIKGMEMPENCYFCPCSDLEYYDCNLMPGTGISSDRKSGKRLDDCPLIPVPDHGRLIDADALIADSNRRYDYMSDEEYVLVRTIEDAPTVIPADKDGEE